MRAGSRFDCASRSAGSAASGSRSPEICHPPLRALDAGDDHARHVPQPLHVGVDARLFNFPANQPGTGDDQQHQRQRPQPRRESLLRRLLLLLQTGLQPRGQIPQVRAVALEFLERTAQLGVDAGERVAQDRAERLRRVAPDDGRQKGEWSLLAPEQQIAEPQAVDAAAGFAACLCPKESRTKSWMAVSIPETMWGSWVSASDAATCSSSSPVLPWMRKRCSTRNTTVCLSTTSAKRAAAAVGLEAPLQPAPREAVLERLVEASQRAVERLGDGLANRRSDERVEDTDQGAGIFADRHPGGALHVGARTAASFVPGLGQGEGAGQHGTDGLGKLLRVVQLPLQGGERGPILLQEDAAQRVQSRISVEPAGKHRRQILIDAARHLQQEVGEALRRPGIVERRVHAAFDVSVAATESLDITASPSPGVLIAHAAPRAPAT